LGGDGAGFGDFCFDARLLERSIMTHTHDLITFFHPLLRPGILPITQCRLLSNLLPRRVSLTTPWPITILKHRSRTIKSEISITYLLLQFVHLILTSTRLVDRYVTFLLVHVY